MPDINDVEVDLKIHDAYVAFSAEVVRLALLSPAVFVFFVAVAGEHPNRDAFAKLLAPARCNLVVALSFMAAAVFFGLAHRYWASDYMSTLVRKTRRRESTKGDWRLSACSFAICAAPACLLIGAVFLFISVYNIIT
jgi:hypothetical protein